MTRRSDPSQSNPTTKVETEDEPFHKENLVDENYRIETSSSNEIVRWEKKSREEALKICVYRGKRKEDKAKVGILPVSDPKDRETGEQVHKDCLSEKLRKLEDGSPPGDEEEGVPELTKLRIDKGEKKSGSLPVKDFWR